jgi:hypothetical protein
MAGLLLIAPSVFAEEALPAGMLEFLGTMVESEGELIDPLSMITPAEQAVMEEAPARASDADPPGDGDVAGGSPGDDEADATSAATSPKEWNDG